MPKKDRSASNAAIVGAGATTAGAGLVGGGAPGFKSNSSTIANVRQGSWAKRTGAALSSGRGGIFGYRTDAHKGFLQRQQADEKAHGGTTTSRVNMYHRGVGSGKIAPEEKIIRHMKAGKKASAVALVGGTAAAVYGAKRDKVRKAQRDTEKYHGTLLGVGGTAAVGSIGGSRILEAQGRKWSKQSAVHLDEAKKIIPNVGGHEVATNQKLISNKRVPSVRPEKGHAAVANNKRALAGKSKVQAEAAGRLRGAADQASYFSHVYGKTASMARKVRNPALATAAAGATGLALSRKKDTVRKSGATSNVSAFGVQH
jgi:hypothetical protein